MRFTNLQQKPSPEAIKTGVVSPRGEAFQNKTPPGHRHAPQSSLPQPQTAGLGTYQASKETSRVRCTPQLILIKNRPLLAFAVRFFPKKKSAETKGFQHRR